MILLLFGTLVLSGCASMQSGITNHDTKIRSCIQSQHAWNEWSWCYDELEHPFHFARGFKAGYRDVLNGGKGCQPTLPDKCYFKAKYRSVEGRCKVNAWFDGFSHGALAAQQDGAANYNTIPMSPTARANLACANARPQPRPMHMRSTPLPPPPISRIPPDTPEQLIMPDARHGTPLENLVEDPPRLPYE